MVGGQGGHDTTQVLPTPSINDIDIVSHPRGAVENRRDASHQDELNLRRGQRLENRSEICPGGQHQRQTATFGFAAPRHS